MKYNLRQIMTRAWKLFREKGLAFAEALHRAWLSAKAAAINEKRIEAAKGSGRHNRGNQYVERLEEIRL